MPKTVNTIRFVTLGPEGTNHSLMVKTYAKFRGLVDVETIFVEDFKDALPMIKERRADYLLICGVHPQCPMVISKGCFLYNTYLMDTFISPSQTLGILTRRDVETPQSIAFHPATENYTDISAWGHRVYSNSIIDVANGLLAGDHDSGITAVRFAQEYPEKLRVDQTIGSVDDPWFILGNQRVATEGIVACADAPAVKFMTQRQIK